MPARIKIEDLPVLEDLEEEEAKGLFGGWGELCYAATSGGSDGNTSSNAEQEQGYLKIAIPQLDAGW